MRLPLVARSNLGPEQRELYDDMRQGIESNFKGFEAISSDGALIGPWNPWLHYPKFGGPISELVKVLSTSPTLPCSYRRGPRTAGQQNRHHSRGAMPSGPYARGGGGIRCRFRARVRQRPS